MFVCFLELRFIDWSTFLDSAFFFPHPFLLRNNSFCSLFVSEGKCQREEMKRFMREFMGRKKYFCFKTFGDKFSLDFAGLRQIRQGHAVPQEWKMLWCWCVVSALPQAQDLDLAVTFVFCLLSLCVSSAHSSQSHLRLTTVCEQCLRASFTHGCVYMCVS